MTAVASGPTSALAGNVPVPWDPTRLRDDLVAWLRGVVPAYLEIGLADHGTGVGVVQDGQLVVAPDGRGHFGLIAAVEGPEPMSHIAGRVEQTLRHVGAAVSTSTGQAWPWQAGATPAQPFALWTDRTIRCGWAHHVDRARGIVDQVTFSLPELVVHPPA